MSQPINLDQSIKDLTVSEREQLFTVLTQNIELFKKIIPGSPLLAYIAGELAEGAIGNHPVVQHFDQWNSTP
jgi:hypothetical protein